MGYTDGLLGAPDSYADYNSTLNAYKYFCDDLETNDPLSNVTLADRGMFSAGQKNIRHYSIEIGNDGLVFNYAVDACWMFPSGDPPYAVPDDFPVAANRAEAWRVEVTEEGNTLWNDGVSNGGGLSLSIDVYDWYNAGLNSVRIESPGNFTMVESSTPTVGGAGYSTYSVDITDATPAASSIDLLISVECEKAGYGELLPGKAVTSYFTRTVDVNSESQELEGWLCFLHDNQHTGVADCVLDPATLEQKWAFPTGDSISNSPVISGGTVYFGSENGNAYAVNLLSGAQVWQHALDSEVTGTAAIGVNAIYLGTMGCYFYALSRSDGSELWHYQFTFTGMSGDAGLRVNGAILFENRVYFTANNGRVYCLDTENNGAEIFSSPTPLPGNGNSLRTVPAYYEEEDQIIVTADSFDVICYDAINGDELWRSSTEEFIGCTPTIDGGDVYFTDYDRVRKYDITGATPPALIWAELLNPSSFAVPASGALSDTHYYSLGYFPGKISAHNRNTGIIDWQYPPAQDHGYLNSPAISGDTIYCVTSHGILSGLDTATGAEVFNHDLGDWATDSAIAIDDGRLLVGCDDGSMYCFGPA